MMDESTNYYDYNYPQRSTPSLNDQIFECTQPVTVPIASPPGMDVAMLIPIHRKIHINPSVLLSQQQRESFSEIPSNSSYSSYSSSSRSETRSPVKRNKSKNSRSSRNLKKHKRATDRRNISNNGTKISSRKLARLILGIRADQRRAIKNDDDDDVDELMNRELSDREKVKRTVDARLWLQAKTALKKAKQIVEARDQGLENFKNIRLETINKTFVNRGTSPIVFESPCERDSVGEFQIGNVKTEIELLESDDHNKCQVIEIDSKMEDKLLRDDNDDDNNRIVSFSKY